MKANLFKAEAIRLGRTRYFTGAAFKHGHISERYVNSSGCIVCQLLHTKQVRASSAGKIRHTISRSRTWAKAKGYLPIDPATVWPYPENGHCELCGRVSLIRRLHADHDHTTGRFRGWICYGCNTALGRLDEIGKDAVETYIARGSE